jgi:type II secretory pathway component PulJ
MTLAEVMVAMGVMSVVMALVTAGMVQMYRMSTRADVSSVDMAQLQTAFQQLDRTVRYASAISEPNDTATAAGGWYVEWSAITAGATLCTQMRLDGPTGRLQRRSNAAGGQISSWATVASFLVGTRPFTLEPASSSGYPHQRLTVTVLVESATNASQPARSSTFSFTALNTSLATVSGGVCADMGRS